MEGLITVTVVVRAHDPEQPSHPIAPNSNGGIGIHVEGISSVKQHEEHNFS
jgi:hypothetical protein